MQKIVANLPGGSSEIRIGRGLYGALEQELRRAGLASPCLVVSQPRILASIDTRPLRGFTVVAIPDGERAKTLRTAQGLIDRMVSMRLTRDATAIAVGGGVVGDVTAFAASIYLRGIHVVQVPTTLLAQVDSSVGGKTGVNHPSGKNLIGTFHQPRLVLVDPDLLATLPAREYTSGLYEAVKYGVIRDPSVFGLFETRLDRILGRDPEVLENLVYRSLRIKTDVVVADEREGGLRRILNFGHTIGHGIEAALGYRRIRHGEAVAYGMIGAARLSRKMGSLSEANGERIEAAIRSIGRLPSLGGLSVSGILDRMAHDKKVRNASLHFVLPTRIGKVRIAANVPAQVVRDVIRSIL